MARTLEVQMSDSSRQLERTLQARGQEVQVRLALPRRRSRRRKARPTTAAIALITRYRRPIGHSGRQRALNAARQRYRTPMTSPIVATVNARLDLRAGAQKLGGNGRCSVPFTATSAVLIGDRWMTTARFGKHVVCLPHLPHEGRSMQTTTCGGKAGRILAGRHRSAAVNKAN